MSYIVSMRAHGIETQSRPMEVDEAREFFRIAVKQYEQVSFTQGPAEFWVTSKYKDEPARIIASITVHARGMLQ